MFEAIRKIFKPSMYEQVDAGPTQIDIVKMKLDERIDWRTEMVYSSVRDTMTSIEVINNMYKCKVLQIDSRGHSFIVIVDISKDFKIGKRISIKGFAGIEEKICHTTFSKYGISVAGVFWRTDDTVNVFDKISLGQHEDFVDTVPVPQGEKRSSPRPHFDPVLPQEQEAFMAAISAGVKPPPIRIGRKEYQSDLAPLEYVSSLDYPVFEDTQPRS